MEQVLDLLTIKKVVSEKEIVLLLVKSKHCSVCDAVFEQLQPLLRRYPNVHGIFTSIDKVAELSGEFLTFTAPTILLFHKGKEIGRQSKFISYDKIEQQIGYCIE